MMMMLECFFRRAGRSWPKEVSYERLAGLGLVSALGFGLLTTLPVQAGPFGVIAGVEITSATSDFGGAIHPVQYYRGPQEYPRPSVQPGGRGRPPAARFLPGQPPGYTPDYDPTPRVSHGATLSGVSHLSRIPDLSGIPGLSPAAALLWRPELLLSEPRRRGRTTRDPAGGGPCAEPQSIRA